MFLIATRLAFCTRKRSFACTQSQRLFHKKYPITVTYTKYSASFIKNGEQVMFTNFTRITIKDNRGQNSGKSKSEFELERSFMQEPQFDKVLRQGFLFVKADQIQNWSEQECRTVRECLQIMVKSTCNVTVYKWKNFC